MVAALPPILSDARPDFAEKAGLGDLFHYGRGRSGRRYLFTAIRPESLGDFRSAVVLFAEPARDGRLDARAIAILDGTGRPIGGDPRLSPKIPAAAVVLIHFLAVTEAERFRIVDDLTGIRVSLAA
jgi:hypothetical protein